MRKKRSQSLQTKAVLCFVLTLLVSCIVPISTFASPETVVKIEPNVSFVEANETFVINVTVSDVRNLWAVEVILRWNPSRLEAENIDLRVGVESCPDGVLHERPPQPPLPSLYIVENNLDQEKGQYSLAATSIEPASSFNGSGNIVRITFHVLDGEDCQLDLETKLYDYPPPDRDPRVSLAIDHIAVDGFVDIIPEFPSSIMLVFFVVFTVLIVILSKRFGKLFKRFGS